MCFLFCYSTIVTNIRLTQSENFFIDIDIYPHDVYKLELANKFRVFIC